MSEVTPKGSKAPLSGVFQKTVSPYSKSLSLHPHLYGGELYKRASELRALIRHLGSLKEIRPETDKRQYNNLPPILKGIKEALSGSARLSWWNLFTLSIGQTFSQGGDDDEGKNAQEREYLLEISSILTQIIRTFHSSNTKLLLEIRLTALEVDSRVIELEKLPGGMHGSNETLEYLSSEFRRLNSELDSLVKIPTKQVEGQLENVMALAKRINQLMAILQGLASSNPPAYEQFCRQEHLGNLAIKTSALIEANELVPDARQLQFWDRPNITDFFTLLGHFPDVSDVIDLVGLTTLVIRLEELFVDSPADDNAPAVFSSAFLKQLIVRREQIAAEKIGQLKAAVKKKAEASLIKDPASFYRRGLMEENDLHSLCAIVRYKPQDYANSPKNPPQIQKECLSRMRVLAHSAQPRDLDKVLKSLTEEEMGARYYLLQEVILEQFIFWRKHGIF